ncbi:hypothetical protein MVES1_000743 [Malassezia vespertilionis]|uniref:Uncharacterized protein n=1 Tax=Malassezia vespertilionis TaxID=2020962 RepID=A0A2N1JGJ5_9BASI|nr:uncharacterized protein MVES1_000743 [Malassezia vespertilionis]PKI85672.1 hypothetical protein MVES_000700 [Malassezia vespertilionis]WFD05413.1 hypothetical protein MVES1_000743 [Malassezia vespertilionis]
MHGSVQPRVELDEAACTTPPQRPVGALSPSRAVNAPAGFVASTPTTLPRANVQQNIAGVQRSPLMRIPFRHNAEARPTAKFDENAAKTTPLLTFASFPEAQENIPFLQPSVTRSRSLKSYFTRIGRGKPREVLPAVEQAPLPKTNSAEFSGLHSFEHVPRNTSQEELNTVLMHGSHAVRRRQHALGTRTSSLRKDIAHKQSASISAPPQSAEAPDLLRFALPSSAPLADLHLPANDATKMYAPLRARHDEHAKPTTNTDFPRKRATESVRSMHSVRDSIPNIHNVDAERQPHYEHTSSLYGEAYLRSQRASIVSFTLSDPVYG